MQRFVANSALATIILYNFEDWGTYTCCFKKLCHDANNDEKDELAKMKKWFKNMYYDKAYQGVTSVYSDVINESPDWGNSYTGGQNKGGIKKKTKEQLLNAAEKAEANLKRATKEAEEAKAAADKAVEEEEAAAKLTSAEEGTSRSSNQ